MFGSAATATEENHHTQYKSKVIPVAGVVDFIHVNTVGKQTDDKGDTTDQAVPQPGPETGRLLNESDVAGSTAHTQ